MNGRSERQSNHEILMHREFLHWDELFMFSEKRKEEAAALMESLANNHGFLDGNKRIAFTATDVFLRRNGFYIEVEGPDGHVFIEGSMDRHEFRFAKILDWIRQHIQVLV
jgi:death-on-curing family protein